MIVYVVCDYVLSSYVTIFPHDRYNKQSLANRACAEKKGPVLAWPTRPAPMALQLYNNMTL